MKFGKNLARNQVPEWDGHYIKYKALKKLIKSAAEQSKLGQEPDLASLFWSLDRNLEDVGQFYSKKYAEFSRRLKLLEDRYGDASDPSAGGADASEVQDLMAALLELRGQFRKLSWYGEVNRRGFIKITKKLDKQVIVAQAQKKYLASKVDPAPFSDANPLLEALKKINDWLSGLSDTGLAVDEDARSTLSVRAVASRSELQLPAGNLQVLEDHVRADNATELRVALDQHLESGADVSEQAFQQFMRDLLQRAIAAGARNCITSLLQRIPSLEDTDDINKRNCVHRLVIHIGRTRSAAGSDSDGASTTSTENDFITPAEAPILPTHRAPVKEEDHPALLGRDDPLVSLLAFVLNQLRHQQRLALVAKDLSGRTPLHFAAHYGFKVVCEVIIEHLQAWGLFKVDQGIDGPNWQDNDGWAPLHLSVIGGHPLTTKALLDAEKSSTPIPNRVRRQASKTSHVLSLAVKDGFVIIVQLLVDAGVDINYQDEQGETALHVAACFGQDDCARILLEGTGTQKADTEVAEQTYAWTPLFIACVDGSLGVAELLIEHGAELEKSDLSGWTAKEHAALRGHIAIARRLAEVASALPETKIGSANLAPLSASPPGASSLLDRKSNGLGNSLLPTKATEPVKSFGHRYLTDESMVLVSLGTMDMRRPVKAVSLDRIPMASAHATQLDTALSLVVSASDAQGEPEVVDLPLQDSSATEPIVFHAKDASKVRLLFDLIPTYSGSTRDVLGRGVAILSNIKPSLGSKKHSLQGDVTVPIIAAKTLEIIGTVTFNFLIITPFKHSGIKLDSKQTYWKETSTMVIGHRGLGKNIAGRKSLQLGENTIQSFIAAANLGASYVEFDIQMTKDLVPVIYHDFLVSETGIDAPVHTLTLEQFLSVNDSRTPRDSSRPDSPMAVVDPKLKDIQRFDNRRLRSMSVGGPGSEYETFSMSERMKYTRDFKKKGFKGNSRGGTIQAPFATLEEMFKKLPKDVGFNMEMKYPMLHESEEEEMDTYAVELNSFVDTVLKTVYDLSSGRNMIFSSFNPDVCLLLSFKQPSIPVLFLTDAGTSPVGDVRASSLQEAIRFASRWNLLGVVTAAEPLVISPRLVKVVKESGLVCVSYGVLNNDSSKVELQVKEGIDAVIVDSVLAIRKGLTNSQNKQSLSIQPVQPHPQQSQSNEEAKENVQKLERLVECTNASVKEAPPPGFKGPSEECRDDNKRKEAAATVVSSPLSEVLLNGTSPV